MLGKKVSDWKKETKYENLEQNEWCLLIHVPLSTQPFVFPTTDNSRINRLFNSSIFYHFILQGAERGGGGYPRWD